MNFKNIELIDELKNDYLLLENLINKICAPNHLEKSGVEQLEPTLSIAYIVTSYMILIVNLETSVW